MSEIKNIFWDVDGVLAIMEWGEYNHYGEDDETWTKMYSEGTFLYTEKRCKNTIKSAHTQTTYV